MEIHSGQIEQGTKIDVNSASNAVPTREPLFLLTFEIPERIADILEIEPHTALHKAGSLPAPLSKEMSVRSLAGLSAIGAAQGFSRAGLGVSLGRKDEPRGPQ
jgi:hypothetical protein